MMPESPDHHNESLRSTTINVASIDTSFLSKLIEVVARGVGILSARHVKTKIAQGEAASIVEIATAVAEANKLPVRAEWNNGQLRVLPKDTLSASTEDTILRASEYFVRQQAQYLCSAERIALEASKVPTSPSSTSADPNPSETPSDEWVSKFFDLSKNSSNEEMIALWARILAGEISSPGSYSFRFLNTVNSLSEQEASLIDRCLSYSLTLWPTSVYKSTPGGGFGFIFSSHSTANNSKLSMISHYDLQVLTTLGIIAPSDSITKVSLDNNGEREYFCNNYLIRLSLDQNVQHNARTQIGPVKLLTPLAHEFLTLVTHQPETSYIIAVSRHLKSMGYEVASYKDPVIKQDNGVLYQKRLDIDKA